VQVALDGKAEWAAQFANLAHADEAELLGPSWPALRVRLKSVQNGSCRFSPGIPCREPYI
jgi:hypothetical protein